LTSSLFEESDADIQVEVAISPEAIPLIASYRRPGSRMTVTGERARMTIPFSNTSTAVRMISVLPGIATIEGPTEVRSAVADFARTALDAYSEYK
jgi:proteasome accessory factor C